MVEDFEVDWDLFEVKKKLLKFETKHKTRIYFWDFVNAVHKIVKNCERRSQLWTGIVNGDCERTRHHPEKYLWKKYTLENKGRFWRF